MSKKLILISFVVVSTTLALFFILSKNRPKYVSYIGIIRTVDPQANFFQLTSLIGNNDPETPKLFLNSKLDESYLGKCVSLGGYLVDKKYSNYSDYRFLDIKSVHERPFSECDTGPKIISDDLESVHLSGYLVRDIRPAPDMAYDYKINLDTPYLDELNSIDPTKPQQSFMTTPIDVSAWEKFENNIGKHVDITGFVTWGYAESRYIVVTDLISTDNSVSATNTPRPTTAIPKFIDLKVQFVPQAPKKVWDDLHNDACEEAAVLNAINYAKKGDLKLDEMDDQIISMVDWQIKNLGGHYDLTLEETKKVVEAIYPNLKVEIISDPTIDDIKKLLLDNHPVVVPSAGRLLGNPNFRAPGPVYHMLVIRGYDDKKGEFITNDVGTRKGESYRYKYDVLINSIHEVPQSGLTKKDLDANPDLILSGPKKVMIIY